MSTNTDTSHKLFVLLNILYKLIWYRPFSWQEFAGIGLVSLLSTSAFSHLSGQESCRFGWQNYMYLFHTSVCMAGNLSLQNLKMPQWVMGGYSAVICSTWKLPFNGLSISVISYQQSCFIASENVLNENLQWCKSNTKYNSEK